MARRKSKSMKAMESTERRAINHFVFYRLHWADEIDSSVYDFSQVLLLQRHSRLSGRMQNGELTRSQAFGIMHPKGESPLPTMIKFLLHHLGRVMQS